MICFFVTVMLGNAAKSHATHLQSPLLYYFNNFIPFVSQFHLAVFECSGFLFSSIFGLSFHISHISYQMSILHCCQYPYQYCCQYKLKDPSIQEKNMTQKTVIKRTEDRMTFLSKYQQVFSNNPTWGRLEYLLQMSYTNVSIQIKRIYVIATKNLENRFVSINQDKAGFQVILAENQLNKAQDFSTVSEKGFKYPLAFNCGKMEFKNIQKEMNEDYYEVMVCRAAVGNAYIFPSKNATETVPLEEKPELMTKDFDSVCIYDQLTGIKEYKQNYIIYEPQTKCLPEYIVHFMVDSNRYRELQEKIICELCEDNLARKYCETQDSYFCISCDNSHHHNRLSHKHKRTELLEKPKVFGPCPLHPNLKMELYCMSCNRTLCINCKVKGDHSSGDMLMHTLTRISEKYFQTEKSLQQIDAELDFKKKHLLKSISTIESKLKEINKKNDEIQNKIYEIMQDSLRQLEKITKKKMSLLMSDHIELKRQLDLIQWMERYLNYEHEVLSPNDFLLSFSRYENMKKDLLSRKFQITNIMPDIRVQGYLSVLTEEQSRQGVQKSSNQNTTGKDLKKASLFEKAESKNDDIIKSRLPWTQKIDDNKQEIVKSRNNLLNLSILKHI